MVMRLCRSVSLVFIGLESNAVDVFFVPEADVVVLVAHIHV
jgi:hypothetical protein